MRKTAFSRDEAATSSVLGEVLAVSIVVSIVGIAGAAALNSLDDTPALTTTQLRATIDCGSGAWFDGDERIVIYHRGGPSLDSGEMELRLNVNGRLSEDAMAPRVASSRDLDGGGVHGADLSHLGKVDAATQAAADAAAATEAAALAAEAAAQAAVEAADEATVNLTSQLVQLSADAQAASATAAAAASVLDEPGTRSASADVIEAWSSTKGIAASFNQASIDAQIAQGEVAQAELEAWLAVAPLGAATPLQLDEIGWAAEFLAQKNFVVMQRSVDQLEASGSSETRDPLLDQAAATAMAQAEAARAAADAAAAALASIAPSGFAAPAFDVGGAWVSATMTLRRDAYISYTILRGEANAIVADGIVTERICGGQSTVVGTFREVFGLLPYIDRNCDGEAGVGDELLERSDFDDGYFRVFGAKGCLFLPAGVEPIVADSIYLEAPEGVYIGIDLTSTSGPIELVSGGPVVVSGITIDSAEGVSIEGGSVDARLANITAPEGSFKIHSSGGTIDARGMGAVAGRPADTSTPEPIIDLPDQAGPGSIRMCAALLDATNRVTNGWQWSDRTFTIGGRGGTPTLSAEGILPDVVIGAPIPLNADIFYDDGIKDSYCVTYNDLEIGGWFYEQGRVDDPSNWETSLHNDQNRDAITTVDDFFHYSPELFDADPSNDGERDTNADGHMMLTDSRPFRTMVTLFRSTETISADVAIDSNGGDIDLSDAQFLAHAADVSITSDGGDITAHRFAASAAGELSQVRLASSGGAILATGMTASAPGGQVLILARAGPVDLAGTQAVGMYGVDISGGPDIDLSRTTLTSSQDQVDVYVTGLLVTVTQNLANVSDRDGVGSILAAPSAPTSTAILIGAPSSGGFTIL